MHRRKEADKMAAVEIEVEGIDRVVRKFDKFIDSLKDELQESVMTGADLIRDIAVELVPVRTGRLRASIQVLPGEQPMTAIVRAGGSGAPYARHVEYGTPHMSPRSYMRPAADARRDEVVALIRDSVVKLLRGR
jgi:HK97 gp10 family phage protein